MTGLPSTDGDPIGLACLHFLIEYAGYCTDCGWMGIKPTLEHFERCRELMTWRRGWWHR